MNASQLFAAIGPENGAAILMFFRENEREIYKSTISTLAARKKLRPVFVQQKPVAGQIEWMLKELRLRTGTETAAQVLQLWLLQARRDMLKLFLDTLGVEHDGDGSADDIPTEFDPAKVREAVSLLLEKFQPWEVAVYLHIFQTQQPGGWPAVAEAIEAEPALAAFSVLEA